MHSAILKLFGTILGIQVYNLDVLVVLGRSLGLNKVHWL